MLPSSADQLPKPCPRPTAKAAANLPACPKNKTAPLPPNLIAGNTGAPKLLVPIAATALRVCKYNDVLVGETTLGPVEASMFEDDTNRVVAPPDGSSCPVGLTYFITFASATDHVSLTDYCDVHLSNGIFGADANLAWFHELQQLTTSTPNP
jgi:hypothetical protein